MIGQFSSQYEIVKKPGKGGRGVVYRAQDTLLNRPVSLSLLLSRTVATNDARTFLANEPPAAATLAHPHIAAVHD